MLRLLTALALFAATPLAAETRQHGNLVFDLPEGWVMGTVQDGGVLVLRSDLPGGECEYCRMFITPGDRAQGQVVDWLSAQTRRFADPGDDPPPEITPMAAAELFNLKGRPAAMLGQKVKDDLQILLAVQLSGRMQLIAFEAPAWDEAGLAAAMKVFERDVVPMLEGARFVSDGAKPVMPDPVPGDLHGLWWGTSTWWSMGLDGMMTMQIDHRWLTFWPDGTFYDGTAPAGTGPFDRAELLAKGDMGWGSYTMQGGKLALVYASGKTAEFRPEEDALRQGDLTLLPVQPLPDGTKIDGMVSTFFYSGFTPGIGISGGVSAATETRFHPDGTWAFGSSTGASASFETGGGFASSGENNASGRYEVKDGLVIRYAPDGSTVGAAYIFKSGSDIWIGSEVLSPG